MIPQISATELARWRADSQRPQPILLDVREPWELAICALAGTTAIPLGQLPHRVDELSADAPIVCVCHHGGRSQHAAMLLQRAGFGDVYNLRGGVAAWANEVEPGMPRY